MRSSFLSYALLLCCLTTSLSAHAVFRREAPPPSVSSHLRLSDSEGFGVGSVRGERPRSNSVGEEFDTSVLSSSGSYRASSKVNSLDRGGVSRRLGSEEFNSGSVFKESSTKSPSSDFSPSVNYGTPATSLEPSSSLNNFEEPSLQVSQKYGIPTQWYNVPTKSFTQYEAPAKLSQSYEIPSRPLPTYDVPVQLYSAPAPHPPHKNGLPHAGFLSIEEFDSDNGLDGGYNPLLIVSNKLSSSKDLSDASGGNYLDGGRYFRDHSTRENLGNTFVGSFPTVSKGEYSASLQKYEAFSGGQRYASNGGYLY